MRKRTNTWVVWIVGFWTILLVQFHSSAQAQQQASPNAQAPDAKMSAPCTTSEAQSRIRVHAEEVIVPITVTDRRGEPVLNLTQRDFRLFDNGVVQEIIHWDVGGDPLAVVLVVEASSHNQMMAQSIRALGSIFTKTVLAGDGEGAVITYSDDVQIRQSFTSDHDLLQTSIKGVEFGSSEMRLYDAMQAAVQMLLGQPSNRRRVLLVVGESQDATSQAKLKDVLRDAVQSNVAIYSVGPSSALADLRYGSTAQGGGKLPPLPLPKPLPPASTTDPPATPIGRPRLDVGTPLLWLIERGSNEIRNIKLGHAVEATGGMHFRTLRDKSLAVALDKIGGELHTQYVVTYKPNFQGVLTGFHEIRVTLSRDDVVVRLRPGYFAAPVGAQAVCNASSQ